MSNLRRFMKENKAVKETVTYGVTKSLRDEEGNVLLWTIKPISTKESESIRDNCIIDVPIKGKSGMYRPKVNTSKYIASLICASVVEPNLNDKELQNSYGVMSAEELIKEMVSDPGEYNALSNFIQEISGFSNDRELVEDEIEKE